MLVLFSFHSLYCHAKKLKTLQRDVLPNLSLRSADASTVRGRNEGYALTSALQSSGDDRFITKARYHEKAEDKMGVV
jgi:hypothetical protein